MAKEKGLEPLALAFLDPNIKKNPEELASAFINEELGVANLAEAIKGAQDIIAEILAEDAQIRKLVRNLMWQEGIIISKAQDKEAVTPYEMYYDYQEALKICHPIGY